MIWSIVGPILALALSAIFTIWHTRRVREDAIKQAYNEQYLIEIEQWVDSVIRTTDKMKSYVSDSWEELKSDIENLICDGVRLTSVKPFGDSLLKQVEGVYNILSELPNDRRYDQKKVLDLKIDCFTIKDTITHIRYAS